MTREQAQALAVFLNRAVPYVHMTFGEAAALQGAFTLVEAVANGRVELEIKSNVGEQEERPRPHAVT